VTPAEDEARAQAAVARFHPRNTVFTRALTRLVVATSRWVMTRRNRLEVTGLERFESVRARTARAGRGLLTFSNHVSLLDDPLLVANFVDPRDYEEIRWVAADALNFFGDGLRGVVFSAGRCVPVVRGWGESQPGMAFLRDRLQAGDWVHIFPEGGRTREPGAWLRRPFKAGIGRLLDETRPVALGLYHHGMAGVLPIGARVPSRGHAVTVRFGEPAWCDEAFIARCAPGAPDAPARWAALAGWAESTLAGLEAETRGPRP
jgi:monolysocardiolipin acyltransferase